MLMQQNRLRNEEHQQEVFGGKVAPEYTNDVISHYHIIYFEFLQCIINAIKDRFKEYKDVMAIYGSDFTENKLQVQLKTLQKHYNTCIRSVTDTLRNLKVKIHLSEVFKLTKLILILPAINTTSERTFSLLKLIKSYLQSTLEQSRLNHLMILSAYKNEIG